MRHVTRLTVLPPMPEVPPPLALDSVPLGNSTNAPEVKLDLPIAPGPLEPTWASFEKNYPDTPEWLREAKFGIWVHFGPQATGRSGDWYARNLYKPGHLLMIARPADLEIGDTAGLETCATFTSQ